MGVDAHPNERRARAKANRVREPRGCIKERAGREGERAVMSRLRRQRRPRVWYRGWLESYDVGGKGEERDGHRDEGGGGGVGGLWPRRGKSRKMRLDSAKKTK